MTEQVPVWSPVPLFCSVPRLNMSVSKLCDCPCDLTVDNALGLQWLLPQCFA